MNDRSNGAADTETVLPLGQAIKDHATALIKANTRLDGQVQINPLQLYCDVELSAVRLEVLFEALVERGLIDPAVLMTKLSAKLKAETEFMNKPQLAIERGSVRRGR